MSAQRAAALAELNPQPWLAAVERGVTRHASRAAWLKARAEGIGGSEAAIIMGASSWGSPYQLWQDKAGLAPVEDFDNEVLRFGRVVEPVIAADYEQLTGRQLLHLGDWAIRKHPRIACMFATHDRIIVPGVGTPPSAGRSGPGILSIKSANTWRGVEWLEGEEPPLPYQVQFQHELACSGFTWGSFAVLVWGKGVKWIDAVRNERFIATLEAECEAFWGRVTNGDPPPIDGSEHTTDALRRLYPGDGGNTVVLPPEAAVWAARVDEINAQVKQLEAEKDELHNRVRALLKDATEGGVPGGPAWTYRVEGAKQAELIPEHMAPANPGKRVLRRKGGNRSKKGK
jgi:putative phage-type endonuclease